jgi:glycine betaine/proline transport system ATP-binding protein
MEAKLSVRNLFKVFGARADEALERLRQGESKEAIFAETGATVAVQDASFDVTEGEIFVVMGLSGSGKSTLVRMLNGLIPPTAGAVWVEGRDIAACDAGTLREIQRRKIAMVFQHFALFPHWSVAENAAYGLKVKGVPPAERRARALAALEQVGLAAWADSLPAELSGGMQQRVGLARGLATGAPILLMDEPFGALDPLIRREMQDELIALQKTLKRTIVFITHDLDEALILGDKIAIMKDGRIVQIGTAQEIVAEPADDYVAAFVADIDRGKVFRARDVAEPPEALALGGDARTALRRMEALDRDALCVLDGGRLAGAVTYRGLSAAGEAGLGAALAPDVPQVEPDVALRDLYAMAGAGLPIAVTEGERLVGVIDPCAVLAQLSAAPPGPEPQPGPDPEAAAAKASAAQAPGRRAVGA